jgi:dihydrolipoamide dehydrogenase
MTATAAGTSRSRGESGQRSTQVAVIGGGPGGYAAAFLAADLGLQVSLIDPEPNPGGVCLYRGCIPSKALLHLAKLLHETREASAWGLEFTPPRIDLDRMRAWKNEVVGKLTSGLGQLSSRRNVDYIRGRAVLQGPRTAAVETADGSGNLILGFDHAILATGSRPIRLPFAPESPRILDSSSALDLPEVPGRLLVVGGGYIGLELGSVYAALGSAVDVVEMEKSLLPGADSDLVRPLARRMETVLRNRYLSTKVDSLEADDREVRVRFSGEHDGEGTYDRVLVAVGRRPNSEGLGLENTEAVVGEGGFVEVDSQLRTAEPTIFAIGDLVGQPMLAHKASHEGRTAAEVIAGHPVRFEPAGIPAVVFTDPEVAWAGLTEGDAKRRGIAVEVARYPWAASGRALTLGAAEGITKLILEPESHRVLGVGITGTGAGELIAEGMLAIEMGATAEDLKLTIHAHPTLSETVMESAEVFFGQSTHVYRPKKRS